MENITYFDILPSDIITNIVYYLDYDDLNNLITENKNLENKIDYFRLFVLKDNDYDQQELIFYNSNNTFFVVYTTLVKFFSGVDSHVKYRSSAYLFLHYKIMYLSLLKRHSIIYYHLMAKMINEFDHILLELIRASENKLFYYKLYVFNLGYKLYYNEIEDIALALISKQVPLNIEYFFALYCLDNIDEILDYCNNKYGLIGMPPMYESSINILYSEKYIGKAINFIRLLIDKYWNIITIVNRFEILKYLINNNFFKLSKSLIKRSNFGLSDMLNFFRDLVNDIIDIGHINVNVSVDHKKLKQTLSIVENLLKMLRPQSKDEIITYDRILDDIKTLLAIRHFK